MYECKSRASEQLRPDEQKHLFACIQLHSTSSSPGAKTNFARNIATHNTFARWANSQQSVQIDQQMQIKAAALRCKYYAAELIHSLYFSVLRLKDTAKCFSLNVSLLTPSLLFGRFLAHTVNECNLAIIPPVRVKIKIHCMYSPLS